MDKNQWIWGIIGGGASALLLIAGSIYPALSALLSFCHIPLFMVALSLGIHGAVLGSLVGLLSLMGLSHMSGGMFYLFLVIVPSLLLAYFGLLSRSASGRTEWFPVGYVVSWLTAASFAAYSTFWLATKNPENSWTEQLRGEIVNYLMMQIPPTEQISQEQIEAAVTPLIPYVPGMVVAICLLLIVVNAAVAQWILVKMRRNRRPMPHMADIDLPSSTPMVVAVLGLVAAFAPDMWQVLAINLLLICITPLLLAGLSVIHALVETSPARKMWLFLIYTALILSPLVLYVPVFIVVAMGLAEQWIQLRNRQGMAE